MKRILSVFLTVVIVISTVSALSTSVSANSSFENAIVMKDLEYYSMSAEAGNEVIFKITIPSNGNLIVRSKWVCSDAQAKIFNSNGSLFDENSYNDSWGIKYIEKGTYYLSICDENHAFSLSDLYCSFTPDPYTASVSLKLTIKKGTSIQLGSLVVQYENITPVERKIPVT